LCLILILTVYLHFNFILSHFLFSEFYLFIPVVISNAIFFFFFFFLFFFFIFFFFFFFFKVSFCTVKIKSKSSDKLTKKKTSKKISYNYLIGVFKWFCFFTILTFTIVREKQISFFFNYFNFNNFNLKIILFFVLFFLLLLNVYQFVVTSNKQKTHDYIFSTMLLSVWSPYVFWASSVVSLFFIIEVTSIIFFYNFISSKSWNSANNVKTKKPKSYANVIFFQYWVNFFGSILTVFSIINIYSGYGCLNFTILNYLYNSNYMTNSKNPNFDIYFIFLFLGLLIKVGLVPFHLFKQEVYKGLNLVAILFYTIYYFLTFFLVFCFILLFHLSSIFTKIQIYLAVLSFFGALYLVSLLFNIDSIKSFFAYSTIINLMSIFIIALAVV